MENTRWFVQLVVAQLVVCSSNNYLRELTWFHGRAGMFFKHQT